MYSLAFLIIISIVFSLVQVAGSLRSSDKTEELSSLWIIPKLIDRGPEKSDKSLSEKPSNLGLLFKVSHMKLITLSLIPVDERA